MKEYFLSVLSALHPPSARHIKRDAEHQLHYHTESEQIYRTLSRLLISTHVLSRQCLLCHWQPMEPGDTGLHSLFEQHFQSLRKAADALSQRIHALGYELPDAFTHASGKSDDEEERSSFNEMIKQLIQGHRACARDARKLIGLTERAEDDITSRLASQRIAEHDQAAWLLQALIEEPVSHSLV